MQSFKILLTQPDSASQISGSTGTTLGLGGGYYSNNQSGLNLGVVTEFNVNQFLENPENIDISTDFFNYLVGNTNSSEFEEITNSNKKLASIFTDYYSISITSGLTTPTSLIDNELTGTTGMLVTNNNYNLLNAKVDVNGPLGYPVIIKDPGNRDGTKTAMLTTYTDEESYYLPVGIKLTAREIPKLNFSDYSLDCFKEIDGVDKFLVQCFVDLNFEKDENSFWVDPPVVIVPVVEVPVVATTKMVEVCEDVEITPFQLPVYSCIPVLGGPEDAYESSVDLTEITGGAITCTLLREGALAVIESQCTMVEVPI